MTKDAWVLILKDDGKGYPRYLCDDDSVNFLTADLNKAKVIFNKQEQIKQFKLHDKFLIKKFGDDSIRNFGWENISKNFEFVEVEVEEVE